MLSDRPVVRVHGELDCAAGPHLESSLIRTLSEQGSLVVDLSAVSFVDCAGLGSLISVRRWAAERGLSFAVTRPAPAVRRLLVAVGQPVLEEVPAAAFPRQEEKGMVGGMNDTRTDLEVVGEELRVADEEVRVQQELIEQLVRGRAAEHLAGLRLAAALPVPLVETDQDGLITEANPAAAALFHVDPTRLRGKPLPVLVDPADRRQLRGALARAVAGGRPEHLIVTVTPRRDGRISVDTVVLPDPAEHPLHPDLPHPPAARWVLIPRTAARPDAEPDLLTAVGAAATLSVVDGDLRAALTRVADLSVQALPAALSASVVVGSPAEPGLVVSTDRLAQTLDGAQHRSAEGPVWDAYGSAAAVTTGALRADARWPVFGPLVPAGTDGAAAVPIPDPEGGTAGVLTVYGTRGLDGPDAVPRVRLFATAAAALLREHAAVAELRRQEAQLREALTSRAVIDQAKGILIARHRIDADAAFTELARRSQQANVKLREVARQLVEEAAGGTPRPAAVRRSPSAPRSVRPARSAGS